MKPKLYTLSLLFIIAVIGFSCKTASKLYEKGDYDAAVELAAKKLQKDPNDVKLRGILQNAYEYALRDHEDRIRANNESNNELKWEWIYAEYVSLQRLYDAINRTPSVFDAVNPVNYSSHIITFAERAGQVRFDRGLAFMESNDRNSFRQAYREFQLALQFHPGQRDYQTKLSEAYSLAVANVVVLPMQQQGGYVYSGYSVGSENLDDQVIRNLGYNSGDQFVRFYSAWDARSKNIRVDAEVELRMMNSDIGHTRDSRTTRRVSAEVEIKETVYKPDSVVKEYGKVYGDITTTHRSIHSDARLQIILRDFSGRIISTQAVSAEHDWSTDFATFSGDARALSASDQQLVNRRKEFAPPDSEIMRCLVEELGNDATYTIRNLSSRF